MLYFCGIDVAKRKHAVAILDERGQLAKPVFEVENSHEGLGFLVDLLKQIGVDVCVGLEATGHYWLSLYDVLTQNGYPVVVINPLQIHAYRKSGVRKVKNDRTDAVWIADFVRIANLPAASRAIPALMQLRELCRFRFWLAEQIGDCKRKLLTILDRVFPEYEKLFSSVFITSSRALLQEAVSAQDFVDFDLQELSALLAKTSRGRFGEAKARQVQAQAKQSIGISILADTVQVEMRCLLAQLELLEDQTAEMDATEEALMAQIPQHITSIPGVGAVTGAAILAEIGDVNRFENEDKLVAYAGIDASVHQSGQFQATEMHMSKRGSPYLRLALWQAASMCIQHNEELSAYYHKKRDEGRPHGVETHVYYLHADHLGSTSLTTNESGVVVSEIRYKAWGEVRYASGATPTDYKYTGQLETDIGIYFYVARFYDSDLGRFIQPDSIIPEPYNPLTLDRYAYARNNSIRYIDPLGHDVGCPASNPACLGISGYSKDPRYSDYLKTVKAEREKLQKLEAELGLLPIIPSLAGNYSPGLPPKPASMENAIVKSISCPAAKPPNTITSKSSPGDFQISSSSKKTHSAGTPFIGVSGAYGGLGNSTTGSVEVVFGDINAIYSSTGHGVDFGGGANAAIYGGWLWAIDSPEEYAGWGNSVNLTVSVLGAGIIGGVIYGDRNDEPGGIFFGYAPGARASVSFSRNYSTYKTFDWR